MASLLINGTLPYNDTEASIVNATKNGILDGITIVNEAEYDGNSSGSGASASTPTATSGNSTNSSGTNQTLTSDQMVNLIASNDSAIIRETFRLYGSIYLGCVLLFCFLRKYKPRLFNVRGWVRTKRLRGKIAKSAEYPGLFSWFWKVFKVDDETILDDCGMDALCFIRATRFGRNLSMLGCFNAAWLIPVYYTAEDSVETSYLSDPFVLMSISNIPQSSPRFLATILAAYLTFGYAMYLVYQELLWFVQWRHIFLSLQTPRSYAVYVSGIPKA